MYGGFSTHPKYWKFANINPSTAWQVGLLDITISPTCQVEVTSNSEKIKPIALAIMALHLSEGVSQSRKFHFVETGFWSIYYL